MSAPDLTWSRLITPAVALAATASALAAMPLGALDPQRLQDSEDALTVVGVALVDGACGGFGPADSFELSYSEATLRCGKKPPIVVRFADTPHPRTKDVIGPNILYVREVGGREAEIRVIDERVAIAARAWEMIAALTDAERAASPDPTLVAARIAVTRPVSVAWCSDDDSAISYGWNALLLPRAAGLALACGDAEGRLIGEAFFSYRDNPQPTMEKRFLDGSKVTLMDQDGRARTITLWKKAHDAPFASGWQTLVAHGARAEAEESSRFAEAATAYRAAAVKPELPEDARRFKVQAELAVRERRYTDAAARYADALHLAPWWPTGRYNRALVLAELGEHAPAIAEMKRYLELVPDASNARQAQDKVYEWEARLGR